MGSQLPKHRPEDGSRALPGIRPASEDGSADKWREAKNSPSLFLSIAPSSQTGVPSSSLLEPGEGRGAERGCRGRGFPRWVWSLEVVRDKDMRVIHSLAKAETGELRTLCAMRDWKGKLRPDCIRP